jgi:hypothetical protein
MSALEEYERLIAIYDAPGSQCRNADFDVARAAIADDEGENKRLRERLDDCLRGHYGLEKAERRVK